MRYSVMLLVPLLAVPMLRSANYPLKAANVAIYVLQYREDFPDQKGWKPIYKAVVDITLQNTSQLTIDEATLCLQFNANDPMHNQGACDVRQQSYSLELQPGRSTKIGWPDVFTFAGDPVSGSFFSAGGIVTVGLKGIRYANGFLADFVTVGIGEGTIPLPMTPPAKSGCGAPEDISGKADKISLPRMFDGYGLQYGAALDFGTDLKTVTFHIVVDNDGAVCGAQILQGSRGEETDRHRIEALKEILWFPAVENDEPIASRFILKATKE